MKQTPPLRILMAAAVLTMAAVTPSTWAQPTPGHRPQTPQVFSPAVLPDGHIIFSISAPNAQHVRLAANDTLPPKEMTIGSNGVWQVEVGPVAPGAYRYMFNVDGVSVIDPRNPTTSESNDNTWSLVYVPGADFMDTKELPHGAVATVTYYSNYIASVPSHAHLHSAWL
jgi:hypothetical protein